MTEKMPVREGSRMIISRALYGFSFISLLSITLVGKNDLHIGVLAGFRGFIRVIVSGKNSLGCRVISGPWVRCKLTLFW
jgi:hypothetical protein